jgi:hypothetical protein
MDFFLWSKKNDAIIILFDFSHENVPEGSRDFTPFFQLPSKMGIFLWSKKNDAIFILSGTYLGKSSRRFWRLKSLWSGKTDAVWSKLWKPAF